MIGTLFTSDSVELPQSIQTSSTMSTFKMSKVEQKSRDPGIQSGDLVLLRLPKGDIKSVKVDRNTCVHATFCFK